MNQQSVSEVGRPEPNDLRVPSSIIEHSTVPLPRMTYCDARRHRSRGKDPLTCLEEGVTSMVPTSYVFEDSEARTGSPTTLRRVERRSMGSDTITSECSLRTRRPKLLDILFTPKDPSQLVSDGGNRPPSPRRPRYGEYPPGSGMRRKRVTGSQYDLWISQGHTLGPMESTSTS